jgi:beta-phosphoglucomutase family hydrolase
MSNQLPIKAIIYDVDGTMIDSEPLHVAAWDKALQSYGKCLADLSQEFQATMAGKKPIAIAEGMVAELGLSATPVELLAKKTALFMASVTTDLHGMPGVVESIKRFRAQGLPLGIGTSLDRNYINLVLNKLEVKNYFDVVVTGDEIKNGKPHPDTFLTVVRKLGLAPQECLVLEDAKSGIQSAKAAGCYCIAIKNPNALPQDTSEANLTVDSLNEIDNEALQFITGLEVGH